MSAACMRNEGRLSAACMRKGRLSAACMRDHLNARPTGCSVACLVPRVHLRRSQTSATALHALPRTLAQPSHVLVRYKHGMPELRRLH